MTPPREYDRIPATHPPDGRMRRVECAVWTVRRGTPAAGTVIRGGATAAGAGGFPDRGAGGITWRTAPTVGPRVEERDTVHFIKITSEDATRRKLLDVDPAGYPGAAQARFKGGA